MMKDTGIILYFLLGVASVCVRISHGGEFQGCFARIPNLQSTSRIRLPGNTNQDCSNHCADRGFILAATRVDMCYCIMTFPEVQRATPVEGEPASGQLK